ncbi:MAG TPA: bacteriohemerythrin [Gammaproteobacteria bacterium]
MSPLVTWSGQLEIGVPEIDAHHRTLVRLLNELHEAVYRRRGADACRNAVEKLHRCARSHFDVEEKLMHLSGHTAFAADRSEHRELMRALADMLARMDPASSNITFQGLHQLKAWLLAHIRHTDPRAAGREDVSDLPSFGTQRPPER